MIGNIDFKKHSGVLCSMKSLAGDVMINENKWDFIFDFYKDSKEFYFIGNRVNYPELEKEIGNLSDEIVYSDHNHFDLLVKVTSRNLFISRNTLQKFWAGYENPAIVFVSDDIDTNALIELIKGRETYEDFVHLHNGVSVIYRGIEWDVLWIASSTPPPID